jgi:purine-binding chemotaxis protein CheW
MLHDDPAAPRPDEARPQPAVTEAEDSTLQLVTFFLGDEEYALAIGEVQEIIRVGDITRVPNTRSHVRGVINLRGRIVPVIDLKRRLALGDTEIGRESRVVVAELGGRVLGLTVDRVSEVLLLSTRQLEAVPDEVLSGTESFLRRVARLDERMVFLLDLGQVVGNERV